MAQVSHAAVLMIHREASLQDAMILCDSCHCCPKYQETSPKINIYFKKLKKLINLDFSKARFGTFNAPSFVSSYFKVKF